MYYKPISVSNSFFFFLGIPVMTMEFSIGRGSQKSPVKMLQTLEGKKQHWGWAGPLGFIGNVVLMMFYTCVAGWFLKYFVGFVTGEYAGMSADRSGAAFGSMISNPGQQILYTAIICVIGFLICSFSLNKGLEQVTKYMMLVLFLLLLVLVIHSCTLSGAKEGLSFYLLPDFSKVTWGTVNAAMNQAFFTLSLGIGSMAIFGSYLGKERSLMGESVNVIILDTIVAIMAGLIIFPACSTFGVDAGAGPSLIFVTLPNIFANMAGGQIWGALFFLFMTFAALSTVLAVFENILAMFRDWTGVSRVKGCIICGICIIILSLPCILGFNVWSGFVPFAEGSGVLDLEDFIVSNLLLPIGCFVYVLFCTWKFGWGWDNFTAEANAGKGMKVKKWMKPYMQFVLPVIILVVFIAGLLTFSFK